MIKCKTCGQMVEMGVSYPFCSSWCSDNDPNFKITDWNAYWADRLG